MNTGTFQRVLVTGPFQVAALVLLCQPDIPPTLLAQAVLKQ